MATIEQAPSTLVTRRGPSAPVPLDALLQRVMSADRILTRPIDLVRYASDASFYRLIPKAVVRPKTVDEVRELFRLSHETGLPLTFRAAGTSLSGQSITDGILADVSWFWRGVEVLDQGRRVRVQPGVIGNNVNIALRPYGVKMGPDPASINTCMMGGILSNNSSGMCCGVTQNAYHTLESMTFLLPSGTLVDTADPRADEIFREREPELAQGLLALKAHIESDTALRERIRSKYRTKNTTGYSLNAFIDFDRPVDIMRHVLVGSEGTLAFIAGAVLNTVVELPFKYTGLLLFPTIRAACAAIVPLAAEGAKALEVMDRAALRSVEDQPGIPGTIKVLPDGAAGLLAEFQAADPAEVPALAEAARRGCEGLELISPAEWTRDPAEQALLWKIRGGMFPSVGAVRKTGTTVIIEDVAFPIERLADAVVDLNQLFRLHGYDNAIIFGHAKDGNLHFVITQSFNDQAAIDQYTRLIDDVVELVVKKYDGALKAEHGTGRNMAPFVATEWGEDAFEIMRRLKHLCDPHGLLNPGVILNDDPKAHVTDLKSLPSVEEEVDKCIECGYCEPKCPSRDLTTTPRQRIVIRRELQRLADRREYGPMYDALEMAFPYDVLDTCAVDGLCATACPVSIDTGQLTKRFRRARHSDAARRRALWVAENFAAIEPLVRTGLRLGHAAAAVLGSRTMTAITRAGRKLLQAPSPLWLDPMPKAARPLPKTTARGAAAIYFPACISRTMGTLPGETNAMTLAEAFVAVAARAGRPVHIPPDVAGTCCGTPFSSKGYGEANAAALNRAIANFWEWSDHGRLPVVIDTSPCTYAFRHCRPQLDEVNRERLDLLQILDSIEFVADTLLPHLAFTRQPGTSAVHPVCSVTKMGIGPKLEAIVRACSVETLVPANAGCCGFAGDRGWMFPELTASATTQEAAEVRAADAHAFYSSSRTCEIGMTRATGEIYRSYLHLLERSTRPAGK